MKNKEKQLYEKMVDYKRYGVSLLAVGTFFYLGVVIPTEIKIMKDMYLMMGTSTMFLSGSIWFLLKSKQAKDKLIEMEHESTLK